MSGALAIEVNDLAYRYPGGDHQLTGIDLAVAPSEVVCLLGPNGAGKTTLLRCLLGLLRPDSGTVRIGGALLRSLPARLRAQHVAYVPQATSTAFPFTALDIAVMGRTPYLPMTRTPGPADRRRAASVLDELGIVHLADRPFSSLSGGERSLTLIARALVQQAEVLVLDEPTAALDLGNAAHVLGVAAELARGGRTVVMTTHQPDHALHYADRAVLLSDGRIVADGRPHEALTARRLSEVYRTPVHLAEATVAGRAEPVLVCVPEPARTPSSLVDPYDGR